MTFLKAALNACPTITLLLTLPTFVRFVRSHACGVLPIIRIFVTNVILSFTWPAQAPLVVSAFIATLPIVSPAILLSFAPSAKMGTLLCCLRLMDRRLALHVRKIALYVRSVITQPSSRFSVSNALLVVH